MGEKRDWTWERDASGRVHECAYLGDTMICLASTYEGHEEDCNFVERAAACHDDLVDLLTLYAYPGKYTGRPSDEEIQKRARDLIAKATESR